MKERVDFQDTPDIIKRLFRFPYIYFSTIFNNGSVIDVGCGNNSQLTLLKNFNNKVYCCDKIYQKYSKYFQCDVNKLPLLDNSIDYSFCFEVIEHLKYQKQHSLIHELIRISKDAFILGSVNSEGPDEIDGIEIYKGVRNPYHIEELSLLDMIAIKCMIKDFYPQYAVKTLGSYYVDGNFKMSEMCHVSFCNYLVVTKTKESKHVKD